MNPLFKLPVFAILLLIVGCQSLADQSDDNVQRLSSQDKVADSIYIRFDLKDAASYRGQLSVISRLGGQYIIQSESTDFVAVPYPEGSILAMLSIPNTSFYPVSAGDSITVSYPSYYPYIRTANTTRFTEREINFASYLAEQNISVFEYFFKRIEKQTDLSPEECYQAMLAAIDSYEKAAVVGQEYADWLRREAKYSWYKLSLSQPFAKDSIPFQEYLTEDPDLDSYHYRSFLSAFARKHLGREHTVGEILTVADKYYTGRSRDYLLYHLTNLALEEEGDNQLVKGILELVQDQFGDTEYYTQLAHRYLKVFETDNLDQNIPDPLLDPQGRIFSLNEVITNLKGKLIYMDFWASWCVPCRAAFPHARELKKKRTDVAFVYISIDRQQQAWLTANREEEIAVNSYLMVDPAQSAFSEKYGIRQIPRYFILGKSGEILNDNAPRPGDVELETLFDRYLN